MVNPTCLDVILGFLAKDEYLDLVHELEYLKIYLLCLAKWNDSVFGKEKSFGFLEESHIEAKLEEAEREIKEFRFEGFEAVVCELLDKIEICKPKIEEDCLNFLDCSFECNFSIDELPHFMDSISASLRNLVHLKDQIESLQHNLQLFNELVDFAARRCSRHEYLRDFQIHIQAWACRAACISLLCWAVPDAKKQGMMAPRINIILSDLRMKISPSTPEVTRMYLSVLLKASKPSSAKDSFTANKLVLKFVEFLKDNLQVDPEQDGIQMLFVDLVFLITFLMDPPETENLVVDGNFVLTRAETVVHEAATLISLLCSGEIKHGITEEMNFLLHSFSDKAAAIKVEVRRIFAHLFFDLSSLNFPKINVLGLIDSLLEDLIDFRSQFPKHQIVMLHEELMSLRELNLKGFANKILQNKHDDIKNLWTRIANATYISERAVSSFLYIKECLWHDILCLCDIIEEVTLVKSEVKRIHDILALNSEQSPSPLHPSRANFPIMDDIGIVGFERNWKEIVSLLTDNAEKLDIVSIVGMGGSGKTTLAKIVYNDASIRFHFQKRAWCTVSMTFSHKKMLFDIANQVVFGGILSNMDEEDLSEIVYKSLKGRKYIIVMDDVWDISAWNSLKMSFPNESNGSRIMLTSRIRDVALQMGSSIPPVSLKVLSDDDSFYLLKRKCFGYEDCPPYFWKVGKQIARVCQGVPLFLHLIGSFGVQNNWNRDSWIQIAQSLNIHLNVFNIIYMHIPEYLKACFLYFGSFAEDEEIRVEKLIQLWISEGFIPKHETKSLEVVAEECLIELVNRSLVSVIKRSSTGEIKTVGIHDLLLEFCRSKGTEENLLNSVEAKYFVSDLPSTCGDYRVCIDADCWKSVLEHVYPASSIHSLLVVHPLSFTSTSETEFIQYLNLSCFKFLRILNLDNSNLVVDVFPERITELVLLRYLDITCGFNSIPLSIRRLENLEALCLHQKEWTSFDSPLTIWEMQKLRYIDVTSVQIPADFSEDLPALENVHTFSYLYLFYGSAERLLKKIPNVRKLKCSLQLSSSAHRGRRHQVVKFDFLSHLESLTLCHDSIPIRLPACAFYFPSTLKKLSLINFRLPWTQISPIGKLPSLEVLKLSDAFRGKTWKVGDDEFLRLKFLRLRNLDIQQWDVSNTSFPRLDCLQVDYCRKLKLIPSRFEGIVE